jgi:hypothetical protein
MIKRSGVRAKREERRESWLPSSAEAKPLNFDELAKEVARGLSRREALKLAFTGLTGAALASLGIKTAWAQTGGCTVQAQPPSTDNVCTASPWQGFGGVDFQCCCVQHDYCFSTCGSSFQTCNASFYGCLVNQCENGNLSPTELQQCKAIAFLMYRGVSTRFPDLSSSLPSSGYARYVASQSEVCACTCPDGHTVCPSGTVCSCGPCDTGTCCSCVECKTCVPYVQFCPPGG